jgi:hypothetical protein
MGQVIQFADYRKLKPVSLLDSVDIEIEELIEGIVQAVSAAQRQQAAGDTKAANMNAELALFRRRMIERRGFTSQQIDAMIKSMMETG